MLLDTPNCDIGMSAPPFSLPDFDGKITKLDDFEIKNGLLVAFICNHCPYVKAIADNLVTDAKLLQEAGIDVVAIMPNDYEHYPADNPVAMKHFAEEKGFSFPYLIDEDQSVARVYGAVCTPDFFGFNRQRELQYRGRLDDTKVSKGRLGPDKRRSAELVSAMLSIAETGKGPEDQVPSMGCSIKWR